MLATVGFASAGLILAACGGSSSTDSASTGATTTAADPVNVRVITHDSFALSEALVEEFEATSNITIDFISAGDAGEIVNRAVLASGNPDGDVLFGVDTTLLSRAIDAEVFDPYVAPAPLRPALVDAGQGIVTPIDDGDVCINIDDDWFAENDIAPPTTLGDLADPQYAELLVVQNPATSSPGLAFLMATVARYGEEWPNYWTQLRSNGVLVVNGWSEAYQSEFSGGGGTGDRPLVVSYATSPPAEIVYAADPKPLAPSTSVMLDGCFRQIEFAGVLRGTPVPEAAQSVIDWLVSEQVQADIPLTMFVFPAREGVTLPEVFVDFAQRSPTPLEIDPSTIAADRDTWVEEWTQIVLR
ncbi:MAG: thiamine ABC transporter substrate-binding protein [Candidatus Nanopelagicales bacterium]